MPIKQIRVGLDNFSYVIYDPLKKQSALVDPGYDTAAPLHFITTHNLDLRYILLTHHHSDHTGDLSTVKKAFPKAQTVASAADGKYVSENIDVIVSDGDHLFVGDITLTVLLTPGHTPGGICILVNNKALLTGDTLFIGDCGRTDLPGGSLDEMFHSLQNKIKKLPDHLMVYPGHDYGDNPCDILGNQKKTNKTLRAKTLQEFSKIS